MAGVGEAPKVWGSGVGSIGDYPEFLGTREQEQVESKR